MKYGYARVSTDGQSIDAQVRQLAKVGCKKVFREVASGAKTDRAQLRRLLTGSSLAASPSSPRTSSKRRGSASPPARQLSARSRAATTSTTARFHGSRADTKDEDRLQS